VVSDNGKPRAPERLTQDSRDLWAGLRADLEAVNAGAATAEVDLVVLEQVLRARDRLHAVSKKLDSDGVTVTGSKDQVRPHPLLSVERALRAEVVAGLKQLGLTGRSDYRLRVDANGRIIRSQR
jgi:P27 family predicted phage terminase small subunit